MKILSKKEYTVDFKQVLQDMGSILVSKYGFKTAKLSGKTCLDQSTAPIVQFLTWLESTPEAMQVLKNVTDNKDQIRKIV